MRFERSPVICNLFIKYNGKDKPNICKSLYGEFIISVRLKRFRLINLVTVVLLVRQQKKFSNCRNKNLITAPVNFVEFWLLPA